MSDKKNIDRLFQEKFKNFEVTPNDAVWDRIHEELHPKKKKRRIIPIWWKLGGVAAALVLLFTAGQSLFNSDNNTDLPIVEIENNETEKGTNTNKDTETKRIAPLKPVENNKLASEEPTRSISSEKSANTLNQKASNKIVDKNAIINTHAPSDGLSSQDKIAENSNNTSSESKGNDEKANSILQKSEIFKKDKTAVAKNVNTPEDKKQSTAKSKSELDEIIGSTSQNNKTAITKNTTGNATVNDSINQTIDKNTKPLAALEEKDKTSIEEAIASTKDLIEKEEEKELSRWSIAPNVAPVYFSSFGEGSPIHSQFNKNTKTGDINMSYGINGGYAINSRLKLRAGIKRVDLSYTTNDVLAFNSTDTQARSATTSRIENVSLKQNNQSLTLMSSETINSVSAPELINTGVDGSINQRLGFIEIPLELEYRLVDKKLGVNVIGGFSTFFLNENELFADVNGSNTAIGEANNINSTSYSANFGLGVDYSISKSLKLNLEPTFKYQINTFNNTSGNFQPFFIGVYTGLSFKF